MPKNRFWYLLAKKLSGDILPEERIELEQWLREFPEYTYEAECIENLWQHNAKENSIDSELAFETHLQKLKESGIEFTNLDTPVSTSEFINEKPKSNKGRLVFFSLAAMAVLIFGIYFFNVRSNKPATLIPEKSYSEVSTKLGSKTKLVLPDSTVVWLNAGSKLTYNEHFGVYNRNTTLSGEAFFDVKKGTIPFIIHANGVQIKVLGTAFNVKSYPNEKTTETSLLRGRVEITLDQRPGEKFVLKPNEKLIVANEPEKTQNISSAKREPIVAHSYITRSEDSTIVETSWLDNKLMFEDESFAEAAMQMERWYNVHISFKDESVAQIRLHATFTTETITEALDALKIGVKFNYKMEGSNIIITK